MKLGLWSGIGKPLSVGLGGGGAAWTPAQLTGVQVWYDVTAPLYQDTGKTTLATSKNDLVAVFPDLSGNSRDMIRTTNDGWRPALRPNVYKAHTTRALRFVENSDAMITTATWQSFPSKRGSLYVVAYATNRQALVINVGNATNLWMYIDSTAAKAKFYDTTNRAAATADPLINDVTVHTAIRTGDTTIAYYRDGVSIGNITIGNNQPDTGPMKLSNPAANGVSADILEILLLDHASSAAEQAQIESYFLAKWKNPTRPAIWTKRAAVLTATLPAEDSNCYEPTILYETGAQVLVTTDPVFKMWYTGEWETPGIFYAESLDGITWTKHAGGVPVLNGVSRGCVVKNGATYWLYAKATAINLYTSADGITWALDTSNCITVGGGGTWDSQRVDNCHVWQEGASDWRMLYDGKSVANNYYSLGYATSTDGKAWTKYASNPVLAGLGGPCVRKVGSTFWLWAHSTPEYDATLPTDIYRYSSSDLITWTQNPSGYTALSRTTTDEGAGYGGSGQIADSWIMEVGGASYLFYAASANGGAKTGAFCIKLATYAGTLAQLVTTQEGE